MWVKELKILDLFQGQYDNKNILQVFQETDRQVIYTLIRQPEAKPTNTIHLLGVVEIHISTYQ